MTSKHFIFLSFALVLIAAISLQFGNALTFPVQWSLATMSRDADSFADVHFVYAQLPRAIMAIVVGAVLGLAGSLMQQLTQNTLTSPLTLGTSSGAWLALVVVNVWFSDWAAQYSVLAAMGGAIAAFGLVVVITGLNNMTGLPLVVSGMVVNILLGAFASGIILLNQQFAQNIFIWGAGDLAQNGWDDLLWLLPKLSLALPLLLFAPRILTLMRLGQQGASARGLNVVPIFFALMLGGIWLVSASITMVGIISFIGLLTPNIARACGARTPHQELWASVLLGAVLLLITDTLAIVISDWIGQMVPSGVTAAAIGAPALIWFSRRRLSAQDHLAVSLPLGSARLKTHRVLGLALVLLGGVVLHLGFQFTDHGAAIMWPTEFQWLLRWPRMTTALFAGLGLAMAGVVLQRLIYNPLASPDILGVSSGATFALVLVGVVLGERMFSAQWAVALFGSLSVLAILLFLGRRHNFAPSSLVLTGIALTALIEALLQFCLAKGSGDSYTILLWLSGSTYRVQAEQAIWLMGSVSVLCFVAVCTSRWLTLISIGREFASARGLGIQLASAGLLVLVALMCALVTATMGPVAFVGLVAPHMAYMLGAKQARQQLLVAGLIGATLMLWADWLGQVLLHPMQIAAGTIVSIMGGGYFLLLMVTRKAR